MPIFCKWLVGYYVSYHILHWTILKTYPLIFSFSLMKWCCTSTCLIRNDAWDSLQVLWIHNYHTWWMSVLHAHIPHPPKNFNQIASFVQWLVAVFFASVIDNAIVGCFLHFHEMTPMPTTNTDLMVDRWLCCAPLHEECSKHHGHKGDLGVTPQTCGAIGERARGILVWVRTLGFVNASHLRRLWVTR